LTLLAAGLVLASASGALCQSWTIGNDQIERTVTFDSATGLVTQRLTDLTTHTDLIPSGKTVRRPALEFAFACNGQTPNGSKFRLVKVDQGTLPDGKSLTVLLESKTLPLQVSVVYRVYDGAAGHTEMAGTEEYRLCAVACFPSDY
jgi:hypothetical protein